MGHPFASKEAKALNEAIFETIYHAALEASMELAEKHGAYETFEGSPASEGKLQFNLWGIKDEKTFSHQRRFESKEIIPKQKYAPESENGYNWEALRQKIKTNGLRNSLLVAPMPTASTSQILGVNECFEPFVSNLYLRRVKAGEFIMANPHLLQDLTDRGLWNQNVRNQLMRDSGSVANIECIPSRLRELYKTVWEIKMKDIIDMAADRGKFIDQSQSLNLFIADPTVDKLTAMHFYAWKKGLKVRLFYLLSIKDIFVLFHQCFIFIFIKQFVFQTGMYYLRTRPAVNAIQYTVEKGDKSSENFTAMLSLQGENEGCISCQG